VGKERARQVNRAGKEGRYYMGVTGGINDRPVKEKPEGMTALRRGWRFW